MSDFLRQLGALALASRLRRLSDRLMRDGKRIYADEHVDFEPRWFPVLYYLKDRPRQPITEIATALSVTHPAINQIARDMARAGLLTSSRDSGDDRKRQLSLSRKGTELAQSLVPVWDAIRDETKTWMDQSGKDILGLLDKLESGLDGREMYDRVSERRQKEMLDSIEIISYQPRLKRAFRELNEEWLTEYFHVEPIDAEILGDPNGEIIKKGGMVFFAKVDGTVVGTVAMIPHGVHCFELAKMGVTKSARGRQTGRKLAEAALNWARKKNAREVILDTNPKLVAACRLYRKLGFQEIQMPESDAAKYARCTIRMSLMLNGDRHQMSRRSQ